MNIPSPPAGSGRRYRFFVDVMLGTLARWLRILGYDTQYQNSIDDDELIRCCVREGRIVITRDARLARRKLLTNCLFIHGNTLGEQLAEVLSFTQEPVCLDLILSRCIECNTPVQSIEKESVKNAVPQYVYQTQERFGFCPDCQRIYWAGTHRDHMLNRLNSLVGDLDEKPFGHSITNSNVE